MECSEPGIIRDEDLIAYLAGEEVRPVVAQHLARCQHCSSQLAAYRKMEGKLHSRLHRFDCPPSYLLGEYQLGMLDVATETEIKKHLNQCHFCLAEMTALTTFLAQEPMPAGLSALPAHAAVQNNNHHAVRDIKRAWDQVRDQAQAEVRRIIASLLPQQPRVAFVREVSQQEQLWPRRYVAEDVNVSMQLEQEPGHDGMLQLIGFVTRNGVTLEELRGMQVQLSSTSQAVYTQRIDELGNFIFSALAPATYALELQFPDETIVIDQLTISSQE